jgi:hypothetical protein
MNWHTNQGNKVVDGRIKEGCEKHILICEVQQVRGRGALGQEE